MPSFKLGSSVIEPKTPVIAGSYTTITFTYTAGHPIDDTGYLKIVFRFAGDFGAPQFSDPSAPNFCIVRTSADCRIEPRWDVKGHIRPWGRALFLKVMGGFVNTGEQIEVVFGDRSSGSPGWQMQTFCEETFQFKTLVDPIATYQFNELPLSPVLQIIPGDSVRTVCIAPSQVQAGEPFAYFIKREDRWGNPTGIPEKKRHDGLSTPGVLTLTVVDKKTDLSFVSNPIVVLCEPSPLCRYWADIHGQSEETVGTNTIHDYFTFARDYGLLDIGGHQGNDFQITDDFWATINDTTRTFYEPGRFVTFPGYEWSGNTPLGGDRNVFYQDEGGLISRSCGDLAPEVKDTHSSTAEELFTFLKQQTDRTMFVVPHVGGRYADIRMHDPALEWNVEVHSAWGTFEWLVEDAFRMNYRVGICANSDGHKGRPGASYPGAGKFGSYGGLTCVLSDALDRKAVLSALRARHCYGTTGNRPIIEIRLTWPDGREAKMGDLVEDGAGIPELHVRVVGTGPIERIEIRNGLETMTTERPYGVVDLGRRIKVVWSGAEVRGRDRMVSWDGTLHIQDNMITQVQPVNFWNADQPLQQPDVNRLTWKSVTTGGVAGAIVTLGKLQDGLMEIDTVQKVVSCRIDEIGLKPLIWSCGGLRKQLAVYRLPDQPSSYEFEYDMPLTDLHKGDNPIYIKVTQEDGHMAWTSPVYIIQ